MNMAPIKPIKRPKYWLGNTLVLKRTSTIKNVARGLIVVIITAPEPASPYLIPKNENIINEILSTELPAMYLTFCFVRVNGILKK